MPTRSALVNERLEAICQTGCDAVRATVKALDLGHAVPLVEDLNAEDRGILIAELKALMEVYDRPRAAS